MSYGFSETLDITFAEYCGRLGWKGLDILLSRSIQRAVSPNCTCCLGCLCSPGDLSPLTLALIILCIAVQVLFTSSRFTAKAKAS